MGKLLKINNYNYRIVPGKVEGDRCWGCCQENCQRCGCDCHKEVAGWHLVKGTRLIWSSTDKDILENNLQYYIDRDKSEQKERK